jgi:putative ABC transport system permease protein
MLRNYLKISLRNLVRHKIYSIINIIGLAVGMASCILILLWVQDELSYDKFHENADMLYRVIDEQHFSDGQTARYAPTPPPLAPALKQDFPEIINSTRVRDAGRTLLKYGENVFYENRGYFADPSIFDMFTFPFIKGDPETALSQPFSLVITEEMAEKYFGDEDPIGETLAVDTQFDFSVTGVIKNIPQNTHLQFDFLVPLTLLEQFGQDLNHWGDNSYYTYVMLKKDIQAKEVEEKISNYHKKHDPKSSRVLYLQPVTRIHLFSDVQYDVSGNSDIKYIYLFSAIAFFILIIACINYMNLATARSGNRAVEIGMRKVIGAHRTDIIKQFFAESILLSFIALLIAIAIVELLLPAFSSISGKELTLNFSSNIKIIAGLAGIALFTGILAGSYPALFLSSFQPVKILRDFMQTHKKGTVLRKLLVVIQFSLSILIIIGMMIIYKQLNYIRNRNLGYQKEHIVYMPIPPGGISKSLETVKRELLTSPNILGVTISSDLPIDTIHSWGGLDWPGKDPNDKREINFYTVDFDFVKTFNIKIAQGRDFSNKFSTDGSNYIINETAAAFIGMEEPVGKWFSLRGSKGTIIGVMEDFHFKSLHKKVEPLILRIANYYSYLIVKIRAKNIPATVSFLENKWKKFAPNCPFEYYFLDEAIDNLYSTEQRLGKIFRYFAFLAIFISCLGLFGLASFTIEQRNKEIGIRKILGATVPNILFLLTKDFAKWVLVANIIAWPVAYYAMYRWLQNFAYRTNIGISTFILSATLALFIALVTVSYQSIKTALANPIEALRYE